MQYQVLLSLWSLVAGLCMAITNDNLLQRSRKSSDNIIELTDGNYQRILGTGRNAWIMVFLTSSSPQIGCATCIEAADEYKLLAKSWFKDHPEGVSTAGEEEASLFFAISDLKDSKIPETFSFYGLEHVPKFFLFGPGGNIREYETIELMSGGGMERVLGLVSDIKKSTNIPDFNIYQPMNWSLISIVAFTTFCISYMFKRHYELTTKILSMRPLWALVWTFFTILMLGGYMFNLIRGSQLAGVGENGDLVYFLPNQSSSQFRIETQITGVIYSGLAAAVVGLVLAVPKLKSYYKGTSKSTIVEVGSSVVFAIMVYAFFAGLTSIYEIKQPGYPYPLTKVSSLFK
ncbi:hypothetical protein ZYGR_0I06470 [Zygosaccharomyces rouxii]|uniref:ZYRO0C15356p n=2 Tax=Zygosaccharomyces rouxii TaxID=4956 RepID=C5DUB2_ZYGRC|nr:uncharacterized protein ZYRO0C15356g [Zygosaccharomyces rouxii]KAH9201453.1 hypothetical protein LQ764DRAFT_79386 [Zygosaccharomyces rouxii]GAV48350.1 hypothetical protein ZYGR_0I06470 [Zygosaccharomyces rouxii]CAR27373.1 ZYRO0C15356p [Zygosaccharomyces rouxii]